MNKISCRVNNLTKIITYITPEKDIKLNEFENHGTTITFIFDSAIEESDKLYIVFLNGKIAKTYQLTKIVVNKYIIEIPREVLAHGRLYYTIQHYNYDLSTLRKYAPEGYLYVNKALDISVETLEHRPDLFAELIYKIDQLQKEIELLKNK